MLSEILGMLGIAITELKELFNGEKERRRVFINVMKEIKRNRRIISEFRGTISPEGIVSLLDYENLFIAEKIGLNYNKYFDGTIHTSHIATDDKIVGRWHGKEASYAFERVYELLLSLIKFSRLSRSDMNSIRTDVRLVNLGKRLSLLIEYHKDCGRL